MVIVGVLAVAAGVVALLVALVGGGDGGGASEPSPAAAVLDRALAPGTAAPVGEGGLGASTIASGSGRSALAGFGEALVVVTDADGQACEVCLLLASTADQRARGLMEVTDPDLGGYDGMLFVYDEPIDGSFWMRNTPLPLTIDYFDAAGRLVSEADLEPCDDSPACPSYPADGAFQFAVEVPRDRSDPLEIGPGASIRVEAFACPEASAAG